MPDPLDILITRWTRLGAAFASAPSDETPDLEQLIIETAHLAPQMPRLFIMAATWLHDYGGLIARNRLKHLITHELDRDTQAIAGMLLEAASPASFEAIYSRLAPIAAPRPLFDVDRLNAALTERSQRRATPISRRWGLWCDPIELKFNAIRPAHWIMANNPGLLLRADFRGDLRASIIAALRHDKDAGASELSLARHAGGSRSQTRNALANLELTGKIARHRDPNTKGTRIELLDRSAA